MTHQFSSKLQNYTEQAVLTAKKHFELKDVEFDHVAYQTVSAQNYENVLQSLQKYFAETKELSHSGRRITIAVLKTPLISEDVEIDRLNISEPKPKLTVTKEDFEHFAFRVKGNFDDFINNIKSQGVKFITSKQIGKDRFVKFIKDGIKIELRNNKLGGDIGKTKPKMSAIEKEPIAKAGGSSTVIALKQELEEEREKRLRALADYQNLQKRIESEQKKLASIANTVILRQVLDIVDDFDRMIENLEIGAKKQTGIEAIRDKLKQIIDIHGLVNSACKVGDKFDPNCHEAVGMVTVTDTKAHNKIKKIIQKGYKFKNGQIAKPVKVIVGKKNS